MNLILIILCINIYLLKIKSQLQLVHFSLLLYILLVSFSCVSYADVSATKNFQNLVLLTSKTGGNYKLFTDAFSATYQQINKQYPKIKITKLSISDVSLSDIDWHSNNTLIVTVGTKAAKFIAAKEADTAVIYSMLPLSVYQNIANKNTSCSKNTAIYIDQPIMRQINLSKEIFPRLHRYGVFLGKTSAKRYRMEKKSHHLPLKSISTILIHESRELAWSLRSLSEKAEVFIAINDPLVFNPNNAKWLLYMAYQERRPVIGFSRPYVSAGAAASVYVTPLQLARQTAEMVYQQQKKKTACLFKPQYPRYFNVAVNNAVIQSLSGKIKTEKYLQQHILKKEGREK